jgi:LysM repeat protein
LIAVAVALVACFAPWFYLLVTNYGSGSLAPVLAKPQAFSIILQFYEFIFGFHPDALMAILIGGWPLLILVGFLFLSKRNPFSALTLLLLLGVLLPIAIGFAASQFMPLFLSRYFIIVTPLLFILLTWFISELPGKSQLVIGGLLMIMLPALLVNQTVDARVPTRENYRDATHYIVSQVGPRDIVIVSPPYLLYPTQYYYHGDAMLTTYPLWDKRKGGIPAITEELLAQDLKIIKTGHQRIFLLVSMDLYGAVESKTYLDNHLTRLDKQQFSKNVWVYVYQAEYFSKEKEKTKEENTIVTGTENEEAPAVTHIVASGETLAAIARLYYGDPLASSRIQEANGLSRPNLIHPGDVLIIPPPLPAQ